MNDGEKMVIEDALAFIKFSFTENEGLIAQIVQSGQVDDAQVQQLERALQQLHAAWEAVDLVPKHDARLLWNIIPRLEHCLLLYPEKGAELNNLMYKLIVWLDQLFTTRAMSEEHAIAVVSQHVIGPSFLKNVPLGEKISAGNTEDVFMAVDTLAHVWKQREYISKLATGALLSTQDIIVPANYTAIEKQELQTIMQQLRERITKCWE